MSTLIKIKPTDCPLIGKMVGAVGKLERYGFSDIDFEKDRVYYWYRLPFVLGGMSIRVWCCDLEKEVEPITHWQYLKGLWHNWTIRKVIQ